MDKEISGLELIQSLNQFSGLPGKYAEKKLCSLLDQNQISHDSVSIDDVRLILENLLQELILDGIE